MELVLLRAETLLAWFQKINAATPAQAEAKAIHCAISLAICSGWRKIYVLSDALHVVNALNNCFESSWDQESVFSGIKNQIHLLDGFKVGWMNLCTKKKSHFFKKTKEAKTRHRKEGHLRTSEAALMEPVNLESCSSDEDFCPQDLLEEEDACYKSPGLGSKLQFRKASSRARWDSEIGMADVVDRKGQVWTTTAIIRNGKLYCTVEETLFLMEVGALLLLDENDAILSLQSVYEKLEEEKNGCCWELYEVYKHLKSLGYIVGQHGVPWTLKSVKSDDVATEDKFITDKLNKLGLNELRPAFDVYLPNSKFRKSSPGDPSYVLCSTGESPPSRAEVEVLERQCKHIPVKFCHVENGRVSFFSFSKVDLPVLP